MIHHKMVRPKSGNENWPTPILLSGLLMVLFTFGLKFLGLEPDKVINSIAKLIESMAWPVLLLFFAGRFSTELTQILVEFSRFIARLRSLEIKKDSISLLSEDVDKDLKQAEAIKNKLVASQPGTLAAQAAGDLDINKRLEKLDFETLPDNGKFEIYKSLSKSDPGLVLMAVRRDSEIMLRNVAKGAGLELVEKESLSAFTDRLAANGALTFEQTVLIKKLYAACSAAAHGAAISEQNAEQVLELAKYLRNEVVQWLNFWYPEKPKGQGVDF